MIINCTLASVNLATSINIFKLNVTGTESK